MRVLEIGCGHAVLRADIESATRWTVDGADINEPALQKAKPGRGRTLLYDVVERQPSFQEAYDGLVLLDVLEHVEQPEELLAAAVWHLKPGGWVLLNVPAHMALLSRYDTVVGHRQRYDRESLRRLLETPALGLERIASRYWGLALLPLAWLRQQVLKVTRPEKVFSTGFVPPAPWINRLLRGLMRIETSALKRPVSGTSVMAIAYKRPSPSAR